MGLYAHVNEVLTGRFCKLFNKILTVGQKAKSNNNQVDDTYDRIGQAYINQFKKPIGCKAWLSSRFDRDVSSINPFTTRFVLVPIKVHVPPTIQR